MALVHKIQISILSEYINLTFLPCAHFHPPPQRRGCWLDGKHWKEAPWHVGGLHSLWQFCSEPAWQRVAPIHLFCLLCSWGQVRPPQVLSSLAFTWIKLVLSALTALSVFQMVHNLKKLKEWVTGPSFKNSSSLQWDIKATFHWAGSGLICEEWENFPVSHIDS